MNRANERNAAIAYATGVLDDLYDQWRNAMSLAQDPNQHVYGLSTMELMYGKASSGTSVPNTLPLTCPLTSGTASHVLFRPYNTYLNVNQKYAAANDKTYWNVIAANQYSEPLTTMVSGSTSPNIDMRPQAENGTSSRLRIREYYLASVCVAFGRDASPHADGSRNSPEGYVTVQRLFVRSGRNVFDNFLFSVQPVTEIHPGAAMNIKGNIYVGGDLYTAHSSLQIRGDTSFTGSWSMDYAPSDTNHKDTPSLNSSDASNSFPNGLPHQGSQQKLIDTPLSSLDHVFMDDTNSNDSDTASGATANPNDNGYRELVEVADRTKSDPLQTDTSGNSERLSNFHNADYRIDVDANNNVTIYKGSVNQASDVNGNATAFTPLSTTDPEYQAFVSGGTDSHGTSHPAILTTNVGFTDNREGTTVRAVELDVSALNYYLTTSGSYPHISDNVGGNNGTGGDGLAIYIQDTTSGTLSNVKGYQLSSGTAKPVTNLSSALRGVRIKNGGTVPSIGLTVATPNPVYIWGDLNTGGTSTGTSGSFPHSDTDQNPSATDSSGNGPSEHVSSYNKATTVIVADAINILSRAWTDQNACTHSWDPTPANTTINAALMSGNVPSKNSSSGYSGGIENFPRLHESWGGCYITIHGAFSLLYDSELAKGSWTGNDYGVPNRCWFFDSDTLQDHNPPGFPIAYTYDRGSWLVK